VSAGRLEKKSMFLRYSTCAFGSFLIPPFASEFNNLGTTHEQRKKQNRELRFFSGLGLSLSSFNQVDQEKSSLARTRRSPPQPAAARRSPPQPTAARRSARHDRREPTLFFLRAVACSTKLDANNATLLRVVWHVLGIWS